MITISETCPRVKIARKPDVSAYLDSVEVYFGCLKQAQLRRLRTNWDIRRCRHGFGYRLICNQGSRHKRQRLDPSRLKRLDSLCKKFHGVVHRADVALDIQCENPEALRLQIRSQAILRWKRTGLMHEIGHTTYWEQLRSGKALRRNLVLYPATFNRITGELDTVHFELRLHQAQVVRNQGIRQPSDLLTINPRTLFNKHVRWSSRADD